MSFRSRQHSSHSEARWVPKSRVPCCSLRPRLREWLLDPGSLTQRLVDACDGQFRVEVLSQGYGRPERNEARLLRMRIGQRALIREVRLYCGDEPWVFARTVIPHRTLSGPRRRLLFLGNKPLGAVLFADPSMRRDEMQISCIRPDHELHRHALGSGKGSSEPIWGRRSVFYLNEQPLLVSEVFLPSHISCINGE